MENKIILLGEPRSTQNIYKSRVVGRFASVYMSVAGKSLKESYKWQANTQWKLPILNIPLKINMTLYFGTKRKSDIDNFCKLVFDALTGIVYEDDSLIHELTIRKDYCKENPRIEIIVYPQLNNS